MLNQFILYYIENMLYYMIWDYTMYKMILYYVVSSLCHIVSYCV